MIFLIVQDLIELRVLKKEKIINLKLAYKRLDPEANCVENKRKYLGIVNKI